MKVLAIVRMGPPSHNAGSELMLHTMFRHLARHGHGARIVVSEGVDRVHEDVEYISTAGVTSAHQVRDQLTRWADVIVTHLSPTPLAVKHAKSAGRPLVHLVHNHQQLQVTRTSTKTCDLAVFNSEWLAKAVAWPGRQIIVRPPVSVADYQSTPGDRVTMINLTTTKGCEVFYEMARRRPDDRFLGVLGGYGHQIIRQLPNVEIHGHTPAMRDDIYARTRVLLVPSDYESWGRVATEALCSGIPVIAHPTDGLRESLGPAGIFLDRDDLDAWQQTLADLDDPARYADASAAATARADALDRIAASDLEGWEHALHALVAP